MGLGIHMVEAILREHLHKPISGADVLLIGRQTTYFSPENLLLIMGEHGLKPKIDPSGIEIDKGTIDRRFGDGDKLVSDSALFKLLGARSVKALDHSDYEGAEIIHDLRQPVPPAFHGIADLIVDGSTLDNVFTPAMVLQNYATLLRPGGRLLMVNALSAHNSAYVMMPPLWYVDYFVVNRFADCKAYVLLLVDDESGKVLDNVFWVDLDQLADLRRGMGRFVSPHRMATVVFAEKAEDSTVDRLPNQQDYRSPEEWSVFMTNLDAMRRVRRHHLIRSRSERMFTSGVPGHPFIDGNFHPQS